MSAVEVSALRRQHGGVNAVDDLPDPGASPPSPRWAWRSRGVVDRCTNLIEALARARWSCASSAGTPAAADR